MPDKHLHIVSFDVPFPSNYGGVIDVFYKIKALHDLGVKVHLHCFEYGRGEAKELEEICENVFYYKRLVNKHKLFKKKPYIVETRQSKSLLKNLLKDDYPILFEGLHCTYFLNSPKLKKRTKLVRTHNIEHDYYKSLANIENNLFKKYYFLNEANKLKKYEKILEKASGILTISKKDYQYFSSKYDNVHSEIAFHPDEVVTSNTGVGDYALYHGNLKVGENNHSALFLAKEVFSKIKYPLVISGSKPSKELINAISEFKNIRLVSNPNDDKILDLIQNAHINILPTFQSTGLKLKLLKALYNGRWCIVNSQMTSGTKLENYCIIKDSGKEMIEEIERLKDISFSEEDIAVRKEFLEKEYCNRVSAEKIVCLL